MPPLQRTGKNQIINEAFEIVRKEGYENGSIQKSVGIHNKTKQIGDDEIKGSIL